MDASADVPRRSFAFGLERAGFVGLARPRLTVALVILVSILAGFGLMRLKVDDSLSELFRTNTEEFRRYEEIDRRFPSSEYDVLIVVEGKNLLKKEQLEAFRRAIIDLQLADGVDGIVSMLSARGKPDATGYAAPIVPDELPDGPAYDAIIAMLKGNEIVSGKFLSDDGELALAVLALDRAAVQEQGAKQIIANINDLLSKELKGTGLRSHLTGAPVMQLEIRNAVERDQIVYNGLGLLFGAIIAVIFFKRVSLMLLAALPPVLAVLWSLGLLGWLGIKLNLFLNVMTPLVMVMGFADSMQMVSAIRIRLREGDTKGEAVRFADGMRTLRDQGTTVFVEVGPAPTLIAMGQRCLPGTAGWIPTLRKGKDDWTQILGGLAQLYVGGVSPNWVAFDRDYRRLRVALPTYPFERQRCWLESATRGGRAPRVSARGGEPTGHPLLGLRLQSALPELQFETELGSHSPTFVADHAFYGQAYGEDHIKRALEKAGFQVVREGKHVVMSHGHRILTVPRHNPVNAFTMGAIAQDAGLTPDEFRKLL